MPKSTNPVKRREQRIEEALFRQRAFWDLSPVDEPLLSVTPWQEWQPYAPYVRQDGNPLPEGTEIIPGLLNRLQTLIPYRPNELFDGAFIKGWGPYDCCWTEAMLGCRIFRAGPSVWTEPFLFDWDRVNDLTFDGSNPWLHELLAVNQVLVEHTRGNYPVCQALMRGPLDMVEAAVPTDMLYAGFYEEPGMLGKLLDHCAGIFIAVAKKRLEETPPFYGGYMVRSEWGLWAPGSTVQFQADAMKNLSPEMYRDFILDIDRRIATEFEYSIFHTHSGSAHILPVLAGVPELKAVEVVFDPSPYGPPPLQLLPSFEMLQRAGKSLYIDGPLKRSQLDQILETLSPAGLALRVGIVAE